jgi:GYF domain 2
MNEWYYASGGKQSGPVSFERLSELAKNGELSAKDLVWNSTMKDWTPAGQVQGIFSPATSPAAVIPPSDPSNPYAAPTSAWTPDSQLSAGVALEEIPPGSEPINVGACVKRGFDLTVRNIGMVLGVTVIGIAIFYAFTAVFQGIGIALGAAGSGAPPEPPAGMTDPKDLFIWGMQQSGVPIWFTIVSSLIQQAVTIFLMLGATQFGLNLVSGKEVSIGMLFGGGKKFLPAVGASILYWIMVYVGLIFLIFPGIYLAMRYGQFMAAIVDRNLGVFEAFSYSSKITKNNRMNLFLLALLGFLIVIAGCLALCVGLIFAFPVIMLSNFVAYRWMQYGHRAALDYPGTTTPMLTKV